MSTRAKIAVISAMTAVGFAMASVLFVAKETSRGSLTPEDVADATDGATLTSAAAVRVFFGHQSVGANITQGIPATYAAGELAPPPVIEITSGSTPELPSGGFFAHGFIGENGDPEGKMKDFDAILRSGLGDQVDVALMKLCYVDITADTDVDALFASYQETLTALERDFPEVTFLHVTTPLTTAPGLKSRVKALLGRGHRKAADNASRERLNTLIRQAYGPERLFDLAELESTAPDGTRVSGSYDGKPYYSLYDGYALDEGHLTPLASQLVASELLALIADTEQ